jgi:hypothetical protein
VKRRYSFGPLAHGSGSIVKDNSRTFLKNILPFLPGKVRGRITTNILLYNITPCTNPSGGVGPMEVLGVRR